jgi:PAS domain S-box-containing protein
MSFMPITSSAEDFKKVNSFLVDNMSSGFAHLRAVLIDGALSDYEIVRVNTAFKTLFNSEDVSGKLVSKTFPNILADNPRLASAMLSVATTGQSTSVEYLSTFERWFSFSILSPAKNEIIVLVTDITSHKIEEQTLRENEDYFSRMFEVHDVVQIVVDPETGAIIHANKAAENFYGWTHDVLCSMNIQQINTAPLEKIKALMQSILTHERDHFNISHRKADGSIAFVEVRSSAIVKSGKMLLHSFIIDRTEQEKARKALVESEQLLRSANTEKDKFFSVLAHDLKSPFSTFMMAMEMFSIGIQSFTFEEIEGYVKTLNTSAKRIYTLLDNLLQWANLQRGILVSKPESLHIVAVTRDSIFTFSSAAQQKDITISLNADEYLIAYADKNMVSAIIRNLLSNALKFTPRGGQVSLTVTDYKDSMIQVAIRDSGIGMSSEILKSLFSLSGTISRPGTEKEPSSGLGLVLCKEFVEKQNGKIWVESNDGAGSTFYFTLPKMK